MTREGDPIAPANGQAAVLRHRGGLWPRLASVAGQSGRVQALLAALCVALILLAAAHRQALSPAALARVVATVPPPVPLLEQLRLQPSAGVAALPFTYLPDGERPPRADRLPPEQLSHWREYALHNNCSLDDADYEQIFQQLHSWRLAGGIREEQVEAAHARLDQTTLFELRGGAVAAERSKGGQSVEYWRAVLAELAPVLPDMKLLFNSFDKPRSWVAPLPAAAEAALRSGSLSELDAWLLYGCDALSEGYADIRSRHAAFAQTFPRGVRGPLPIFSGAIIPGCFNDLLVPRWWGSTPAVLDDRPKKAGCPMVNQTWRSKKDIAYWRGSSTGSFVDASIPAQLWTAWHRQRLVALSQRHPTHLDAAFSAIWGCAKPQCEAMRAVYGTKPGLPIEKYFAHRYLVVVDGNSIANRLAAFLCSSSVVLLSQLFCEWFAFRLVPGKHFVPVRLDYADMLEQINGLRQDPARAQAIAAAASQLVNEQMREADGRCYMLRLFLEYGALYRPKQEGGPADAAGEAAGGQQGGGTAGGEPVPVR